MTSFRGLCLPLLAAPVLWCVAVGEGALRQLAACSHALDRGESPPQFAAPSQSGAGNARTDLRINLALPGAGRLLLPQHLPLSRGSTSPDGATKLEEGVLDRASVHPPPRA